jgi:hypothetical protein
VKWHPSEGLWELVDGGHVAATAASDLGRHTIRGLGTTASPNHTIDRVQRLRYGITKVQVSDGPEDGPATASMGPPLKVDSSTSPVATFSHPVPS